jgi:putative nucleotidyltransferase with HDIG domain
MVDIYAKENYYDKNGLLLLAKGQKITEGMMKKLESHAVFAETSNSLNFSGSLMVTQSANEIMDKMDIHNETVVEEATEVLTSVIFESRKEPWFIVSNALSNYVDWVYTHSINVAIISLMIAVESGYSDEDLWNIGLGAFLHDVGKMLIPKTIIQKPAALDEQEMSIMKQHCELGVYSLEPYGLPKETIDTILQHHERIDGSGYPKGLKEDHISRDAKIVMVADVVDAVTSFRPYRSPRTLDEAVNALKSKPYKYPQETVAILETILN